MLVPTHRFNTDEDEIQEWLPEIINLWKTMPFSTYFRSIFMRLLSQVTQYFSRLDFEEYDKWVMYQLNLTINKTGDQANSHQQAHSDGFFAKYFVYTFKSSESLKSDENNQCRHLDLLSTIYSDNLHPNNKSPSKKEIIYFLYHMSISLCARVRHERNKLTEDPDFRYKHLFLQSHDIKAFIRSIKPLLDIALQGETLLDKISICLKNFITLD
jgi:hypothetical protein